MAKDKYVAMAESIKQAVAETDFTSIKNLVKALDKEIIPAETAAAVLENLARHKACGDTEYVFPDIAEACGARKLSAREAEFIGSEVFPAAVEHDFRAEHLFDNLEEGRDVNGLFKMLDEAYKISPCGRDFSRYLFRDRLKALYSVIADPDFRSEYLSRPDWVCQRCDDFPRCDFSTAFEELKKIGAAGVTPAGLDEAAGGRLHGTDIGVLAAYADRIPPELLASVRAEHETAPLETAAWAYLALTGAGHTGAPEIIERLGILETGGADWDGRPEKESFGPECREAMQKALAEDDPEAAVRRVNPALITDDEAWRLRLDIIGGDEEMRKYLDCCSGAESLKAMQKVMHLEIPEGTKRANLEYLSGASLTGADRKALADLLESRPETELAGLNYPAGIYDGHDALRVARICLDSPEIGKVLSETGTDAGNFPLYGIAAVAGSDLSPEDKTRIVRELHLAETDRYKSSGRVARFIDEILLKYENPVETPVFEYLRDRYQGEDPETAERVPDILRDWRFEKMPVFTPENTAVANSLRWGCNHLPDGSVADEFFTGDLNKTQLEELYRIRIMLGEDSGDEPEWGKFTGAELRRIRQAIGRMDREKTAKTLRALSPGMSRKEMDAVLAAW